MPNDSHSQEIAAERGVMKTLGVTRSQARDALHQFAQQRRDEAFQKALTEGVKGAGHQPVQTTTQQFPGGNRPSVDPQQEPAVPGPMVVVTNTVCANGSPLTQYTYCLAAPA